MACLARALTWGLLGFSWFCRAGLDSFAALNVMEHMSNLADLGHTIIASIHQPRSAIWDMFDKASHRKSSFFEESVKYLLSSSIMKPRSMSVTLPRLCTADAWNHVFSAR